MKIAISGPGRSGKDCAAEYLAKVAGLRYSAGTSYWARNIVFDWMHTNGYDYADAHECWTDRHNHRQTWADVIQEYNRVDPVQLYRDCLAEQDILTGVRSRFEMQACKSAGLVSSWLWIHRPGVCHDPTMEYEAKDCDTVIVNDGTLEQFYAKLDEFAAERLRVMLTD